MGGFLKNFKDLPGAIKDPPADTLPPTPTPLPASSTPDPKDDEEDDDDTPEGSPEFKTVEGIFRRTQKTKSPQFSKVSMHDETTEEYIDKLGTLISILKTFTDKKEVRKAVKKSLNDSQSHHHNQFFKSGDLLGFISEIENTDDELINMKTILQNEYNKLINLYLNKEH